MKFFNRVAVALLIASLASVTAFAKTRSEKVTFLNDIKVNGTLVKKGVYDLKFDDKTGEVSIVKNGKVVARANSTVEKRQSKARHFEWRYAGQRENAELTHVIFSGADENVVLNSSAASR
jgi:CO dehydrogenase/acetyl-CoA synthase alpha subunit